MPCSSANTFKTQKSTLTHRKAEEPKSVLAPSNSARSTIIQFQQRGFGAATAQQMVLHFLLTAATSLADKDTGAQRGSSEDAKHRTSLPPPTPRGFHQLPIYIQGTLDSPLSLTELQLLVL